MDIERIKRDLVERLPQNRCGVILLCAGGGEGMDSYWQQVGEALAKTEVPFTGFYAASRDVPFSSVPYDNLVILHGLVAHGRDVAISTDDMRIALSLTDPLENTGLMYYSQASAFLKNAPDDQTLEQYATEVMSGPGSIPTAVRTFIEMAGREALSALNIIIHAHPQERVLVALSSLRMQIVFNLMRRIIPQRPPLSFSPGSVIYLTLMTAPHIVRETVFE